MIGNRKKEIGNRCYNGEFNNIQRFDFMAKIYGVS